MATQAARLSEQVRLSWGALGQQPRVASTDPHSPQAIALKPDNPRAYLASAISLGRLGA
jgi:hypothetical protein